MCDWKYLCSNKLKFLVSSVISRPFISSRKLVFSVQFVNSIHCHMHTVYAECLATIYSMASQNGSCLTSTSPRWCLDSAMKRRTTTTGYPPMRDQALAVCWGRWSCMNGGMPRSAATLTLPTKREWIVALVPVLLRILNGQ